MSPTVSAFAGAAVTSISADAAIDEMILFISSYMDYND
jgi:hypothetical protein